MVGLGILILAGSHLPLTDFFLGPTAADFVEKAPTEESRVSSRVSSRVT